VFTCEAVSDAAIGELRREILRLAAPILFKAGIMTSQTLCHIEPEATRLHVQFDLPTVVTPAVKQALAVRVLDAVRGAGRTYGPVHVSVLDARWRLPRIRRAEGTYGTGSGTFAPAHIAAPAPMIEPKAPPQ
jgi:hypothetical protein